MVTRQNTPNDVMLPQLNPSISLLDRVMVGAALSRACIAHECAPTEI